jgi:hypothetical protein
MNADVHFPCTVDLPNLTQQYRVKPCFEDIDKTKMREVLEHMTSYYNRYYQSTNGVKSATWLHNHISEVSRWMGCRWWEADNRVFYP